LRKIPYGGAKKWRKEGGSKSKIKDQNAKLKPIGQFGRYQTEDQMMTLSFLRRQESRVLYVPGFRIKCGMTAQRADDVEMERKIYTNLKKQSQFVRIACCVLRIAERNLKKQSQFPEEQYGVRLTITMTYGGFGR
jgi:hypothetical protein